MKTSVSIDLTIDASDEAKICLNCTKKQCRPTNCRRIKRFLRKEHKNNENNQ